MKKLKFIAILCVVILSAIHLLNGCAKSEIKPQLNTIYFIIDSNQPFTAIHGINGNTINILSKSTHYISGAYTVTNGDILYLNANSDSIQDFTFYIKCNDKIIMSSKYPITLEFH